MRVTKIMEDQEGAKRIIEANLKVGETLAILGSIDVDPNYYEVLMGVAKLMGIESTVGLMTPRTTYGKPAPKPLEAQAVASDLALLTASTSLGEHIVNGVKP